MCETVHFVKNIRSYGYKNQFSKGYKETSAAGARKNRGFGSKICENPVWSNPVSNPPGGWGPDLKGISKITGNL